MRVPQSTMPEPVCYNENMYRKGFAALVVLLVLIVLILAGGVWYYENNVSSAPPSPPCCKTASDHPTSPNIPSTTSMNQNAGWQTYTSPKYNFSVQYPGDWYKTGDFANSGNASGGGGGIAVSNQPHSSSTSLSDGQIVVNISAFKSWSIPGFGLLKATDTTLLAYGQEKADSFNVSTSPVRSVASALALGSNPVVKIINSGNTAGNVTEYLMQQGPDHYIDILVWANPGTSLDVAEKIIGTITVTN
jgi:hypothetical protein